MLTVALFLHAVQHSSRCIAAQHHARQIAGMGVCTSECSCHTRSTYSANARAAFAACFLTTLLLPPLLPAPLPSLSLSLSLSLFQLCAQRVRLATLQAMRGPPVQPLWARCRVACSLATLARQASPHASQVLGYTVRDMYVLHATCWSCVESASLRWLWLLTL
jgi:hypothetical protein